jgi:hypothetical protein
MLMPRFTIRTLLVVLTICAFVFVMVGTAFRGQYWAWGVTMALVSLIATALVHAAWYGTVWLFSQMSSTHPASPNVVPPFRGSASVHESAVNGERSLTDTASAT